ncbi:unnamed protein product [Dibothriocephalus latus]|uniref:Uncharacterized protein n=1 Tax=Dibothriocephalus latus TaxID=60516 RepID=A0A3P7PBT7_DIBLA|nr:unnamed protein product [Dibothriocephalus latus]
MDKEPRNVDCNGSGRSIIPIYSGDQYLLGGREDEVKHDLENPSPSLGSRVTEVSQGPAAGNVDIFRYPTSDVNYPAATSLQPLFEHTGTVMQQCTDWQHYVVSEYCGFLLLPFLSCNFQH